ncbi:6-phosphofructokinase [Halalkalibacter sp. APA_J-10(15)]|uniref:6-phosphofructokinase n=1 Tax=Halalkalibacter sp. APA_J-10(15) TaxID=2933805 RepID=UPI001FF0FD42|nr:6-phosphofructokinase [Halalkalibacter sp. APA_J-10(15)]MCK0470106.1 6-phosphofructokinase [Halalkalibacter sp. APA_J-10(15)]
MKKVAIITSGGDGAGINSTIEMISRSRSIDLYGFNGGYDGILHDAPVHLTREYCENRSLDGVHLIRTSRSKLPYTKEGRDQLHRKLHADGYECLIVCGGNGSQQAAHLLNSEGTNTIFIPMTVDNDVNGSDYSVGFDTALNRVLDVLFGLHDTASNMPGRIFLVEVLGGHSGHLALESAVAGACDLAIIPEFSTDRHVISALVEERMEHKQSFMIMCSESAYESKDYQSGNQGVSFQIADAIEERTGIRVRKSIMGFYIRAGKPSFKDALVASRIGAVATECILDERLGVMIGVKGDKVRPLNLQDVITQNKTLDHRLLDLAKKNKIVIH